jgi:two-component system, LytTR family, sensor histidine kinase AgrC
MNFGWTLFDVTVCFYVCGISMLLLARKLGFKEGRIFVFLLGYLAIAATDSFIRLSGMPPLLAFLILIIETVLYSVYVFRGSLTRRVMWGCIGCGLGQISYYLILIVYILAGNQDISEFLVHSYTRFIILVGDLMALTFLYFIICALGRKKAALSNPPFQIVMIGIFVFVLFAAQQMINLYMVYGSGRSATGENISDNLVLLASVLIIIFLAVLFFFEYTSSLAHKKKQAELELEQKKWETAYLEQAYCTYNVLSAWKHDYQNHMEVLQNFLKNKQYQEMEEYLSQMNTEIGPSMQIHYSGNSVVDAVLSNKLFLAKNKGIQVNSVAVLPGKLLISDVQLSSILGNLLDNAIEAQDSITRPFINVSIRRERGMLQIRVENSANGRYVYLHGRLVSSKKGKHHGMGMANIRSIIESAGGIMDIQPEADRFTVKILLPMKAESEVS